MNRSSAEQTGVTRARERELRDVVDGRRPRTMPMPGFDEEFSDIVEYILRITYRIWEGNRPELVLRYYSEDCVIHTLSGPVVGAHAVANNTRATLEAFPDRRLIGDEVIWSDDGVAGFYTSHRITSPMTHLGPGHWGPPTGKRAKVQTIADCMVRDNHIYEEWLMRDGLAMAGQLGLPADRLAQELAARMRDNAALQAWAQAEITRVENTPGHRDGHRHTHARAAGGAGALACDFLRQLWDHGNHDTLARMMPRGAALHGPSGRELTGPDAIADDAGQLLAGLENPAFSIDHVAVNPPLASGVIAVAVRWMLTGRYARPGIYGEPTGSRLLIMGSTHLDIHDSMIVEAWTVFDELAVRAQVAGGLVSAGD